MGMTRAKITRVESWVNLGIPDCIVGLGNKFHLIELKVADDKGKVRISPHQVAFHAGHEGFPTWLLVQKGKGRTASVLVYAGSQVKEVMAQGVDASPRHETNNPIDWQGIEKFLEQAV
jgi:photosystem II stability/assembly factor-like uncharacterized protein